MLEPMFSGEYWFEVSRGLMSLAEIVMIESRYTSLHGQSQFYFKRY